MRDFDKDQIPVRRLNSGDCKINAPDKIARDPHPGQRVIFQPEIKLRRRRVIRVEHLRGRGGGSIEFTQYQRLWFVTRPSLV